MNQEIFIGNVHAISKKNEMLAKYILQAKPAGNIEYNKQNEFSLFVKNTYILNKLYPKAEAEKRTLSLLQKETTIAVVIGIAPMYHLDVLLRHVQQIIIIEPVVELLRTVIEEIHCVSIFEHPHLHIAFTLEDVKKIFHELYNERHSYQIISLPFYQTLASKVIHDVHIAIDQEIKDFQSVTLVNNTFGKQWVKNTIINLKELCKYNDIHTIKEKFKDIPIAIVGAGPSLSMALEFLKKYNNNILIICVDVASSALKKNGIQPHIICTLEKNELNYQVIRNTQPADSILLIAEAAHPQNYYTLSKYKLVAFQDSINASKEIAQTLGYELVNICSTVSSFAFYTACISGGNPLILIGQDLGYPNEKIYQDDTFVTDNSVEKNVEQLKKKNPSTLSLKERLLLDLMHGSFLTEADRLLQLNVYNECVKIGLKFPQSVDDLNDNPNRYYGFKEICREANVTIEDFLLTGSECAYANKILMQVRLRSSVTVPDINGKPIKSNDAYKKVIHWLEEQAVKVKQIHPEIQLYNISQGAFIKGFQVAADVEQLSHFIHQDTNVSRIIEQIFEQPLVNDNVQKIEGWKKKKKEEIPFLLKRSQEGLEYIESMIRQLKNEKKASKESLYHFQQAFRKIIRIFNESEFWLFYFYPEKLDLEKVTIHAEKLELAQAKGYQQFFSLLITQLKEIQNLMKGQ